MENKSDKTTSPTDASIWSDEMFDYFRTSDDKVVRVRRDKVREAADAEAAQLQQQVMLWNWAVLCLAVAFVTADVVALVVLIVLDIKIGGV